MPDTYTYKARDKGGNVLNGTIVADNEALVLARLREQGFVPLEQPQGQLHPDDVALIPSELPTRYDS